MIIWNDDICHHSSRQDIRLEQAPTQMVVAFENPLWDLAWTGFVQGCVVAPRQVAKACSADTDAAVRGHHKEQGFAPEGHCAPTNRAAGLRGVRSVCMSSHSQLSTQSSQSSLDGHERSNVARAAPLHGSPVTQESFEQLRGPSTPISANEWVFRGSDDRALLETSRSTTTGTFVKKGWEQEQKELTEIFQATCESGATRLVLGKSPMPTPHQSFSSTSIASADTVTNEASSPAGDGATQDTAPGNFRASWLASAGHALLTEMRVDEIKYHKSNTGKDWTTRIIRVPSFDSAAQSRWRT